MSHVIIDRRKNDKGKSLVNRKKFIDRVRDLVKDGVKELVSEKALRDLASGGDTKVKVKKKSIEEPTFSHDGSGINDIVRPGNKKYVPGDTIERPPKGKGSGNEGSDSGEGEDSFVFNLTKEEFLDIFFENCELPDFLKRSLALLEEMETRRAGFNSDGSPSQLNIVRSMRKAKSRRFGLRTPKIKKLKELELEETNLVRKLEGVFREEDQQYEQEYEEGLKQVKLQIEELKRKIKAVPFIDPIDLKYNNWDKFPIPSLQAVMFVVMDVSGSMDEDKKRIAKTFFLLLYLFLNKSYTNIDIVFIRYHTTADIVDEHEFYYGTATGGTVTSTALELLDQTIKEKYPLDQWNIYVAHASDGDNFTYDNPKVYSIVEDNLLPKIQYYAYLQVARDYDNSGWGGVNSMLPMFKEMSRNHKNIESVVVEEESQIWPVFLKLFGKNKNEKN